MSELKGERRWRCFYNTHAEYPLVWSIDDGNQKHEMNFSKIYITTPCVTGHAEEKQSWPNPSAWLEAVGVLEVNGDIALIRDVKDGIR